MRFEQCEQVSFLGPGAQKVPVELELPQDDPLGFLTVQHLAEAAERATGVPRGGQKLIYRGKHSIRVIVTSINTYTLSTTRPGVRVPTTTSSYTHTQQL